MKTYNRQNEKIYILTDGCMWELNKKMGSEHAHAIEVVDPETGAVRYIKSGSKIKFVEGEISDIRSQKAYNEQTKKAQKMFSNGQDLPKREGGQGARGKPKIKSL
jgi:hypothetical protein